MIIGVIGDRGSGKTIFMTQQAFEHYRKGVQVYSNYKLTFPELPNTKQPKILSEDFFENFEKYNLKNVAMFLDEIYVYIDSRTSGSSTNRIMSYFFNQTRKTGVDLYYSTQFFSQVDKRLRFNTEMFVTPKKIKTQDKKLFIQIEIMNRDLKILKKFTMKGEAFFKLYDTDEIIKFKNMY